MSDADEVIIVPLDEEKIRDGMSQLGECAQRLAEKHRFCPPVQLQLLDGHGNQLIMFEVNWDTDGNSIAGEQKTEWGDLEAATGPGLFIVVTDSNGSKRSAKLVIEGQTPPNYRALILSSRSESHATSVMPKLWPTLGCGRT